MRLSRQGGQETRGSRKGGHSQRAWGSIAMGRSLDLVFSAVKAIGGI